MSQWQGIYAGYKTRRQRARKDRPKPCLHCKGPILAGQRYVQGAHAWDENDFIEEWHEDTLECSPR